MKRRVFVAVPISPEIQEKIKNWQVNHDLPIRWVEGSNLHITLVPPWYEEDLEGVKRGLDRLRHHKGFCIALNTIEYGPQAKSPRLIWVTGDTRKEIVELRDHSESAINAIHDKRFKLHITIARFDPEKFKNRPPIYQRVDWEMKVNSVVLMESHLSQKGATYEVLHEVKFVTNH